MLFICSSPEPTSCYSAANGKPRSPISERVVPARVHCAPLPLTMIAHGHRARVKLRYDIDLKTCCRWRWSLENSLAV